MFFVEIKGKKYKVIKRNGILVYKKPRYHCGCNERIPYRESNKSNGVPDFINGHNRIGIYHTEETIEKISNTQTERLKNIKERERQSETLTGITKSEEHRRNISKAILKHYQKHPERREQISEAQLKHYQEHPERREQISEKQTGKFGEDSNSWKGGAHLSKLRYTSKRRKYGFLPFNEYFEDSNAHHIDNTYIIYIPTQIHKAYRHNQNNPDLMKLINHIAFDFLGFQGELKYNRGIKNDDDITILATNFVNIKYGKN